jgi:hypothetical protein
MKIDKRYAMIFFLSLAALFSGILTTTAQTKSTATPTAQPSKTPTPTPSMTPTSTPQGSEIILQITSGADDVNQSSGIFEASNTDLWLGNSGTTSGQYLALRFTDVAIPPGAVIHTAHLEVYPIVEQWIYLAYDFAAEAADDSQPFSSENLPSQRKLTTAVVSHESNVKWLANTWIPLDEITDVVGEVISRPGWESGNSLSIIVEGTEEGGDFGRKFLSSFETDPRVAVRLVIDFSSAADTAVEDACSDIALPARLTVGQGGQIDANAALTSLDVYETPSADADVVGTLESGVSFAVIDGSVCAEGSRWFQVRFGDENIEGWLAEAQPNPYFVEPLP